MPNLKDTDLATLAGMPPDEPTPPLEYLVQGPMSPLFDEEGMETIAPYVSMLEQYGHPFVILTTNANGEESSWFSDGPGTEVYRIDGHYTSPPNTQIEEEVTYVTCKWFAPSNNQLESDAALELPEDYAFDKALSYGQCTNPDPSMGLACGHMNHMPNCTMYTPSPIITPVEVRFKPSGDSEGRNMSIRTTRINSGQRAFQAIEDLDDGTSVVMSGAIGNKDDLNNLVQNVRTILTDDSIDTEEVIHQTPRNSFLKGLITT